jgi:ATP-dependent DNA helicase RecG
MTYPIYPDRESKNLEFKEKIPNHLDGIIKTCVAFANGSGGEILIGIEDQTRSIIGISEDELDRVVERLPNSIYDAVKPAIIPEIYERRIEDHLIIVINIAKGNNKPYAIAKDGIPKGVYIRIGAHTRRAAHENVEDILREQKRILFDHEASTAGKDELDTSLLKELYGNTISDSLLLRESILVDTSLRDQRLSHAALLMFGKRPDEWLPEALVIFTQFRGIAGRDIIATQELTGPIPVLANAAIQMVSNLLERDYKQDGAHLRGRIPIPISALREAVINALIHRKYTLPGAVKIALFDDRLEIFSPGSFPGIITVNSLGDGSTYLRNPLIAKFARKFRLVEKLGSGIKEIFESCAAMNLRPPEFFEDGDFVKVVFYFAKQKTEVKDLEKLILDLLRENKRVRISDVLSIAAVSRNTVTNVLNRLIDRRVVQRFGQGRGVVYQLATQKVSR